MSWQQFKTTNQLFGLSTNSTRDVVQEVFLPSDTNRLRIVRDWPTVKLVLFKTEYVPKAGTLEGKYFVYDSGLLNDINLGGPNYKNMFWSFFTTDSNKFDFKFELKYEKDTASEAVKNIQLTTNSMVFDKVHSVSIPQP